MPRLTPDYPGNRKPPRYAYLRSLLPVLFLILLFSFFLASYSLLFHFRSPARKQQIGWQAWDVVELTGGKSENGADGGNGTTGAVEEFVPSIPLDNWVSRTLYVRLCSCSNHVVDPLLAGSAGSTYNRP